MQSGSPAGIQRPAVEGTALRWALLALALLLIVLCDGLHGTHANPLDATHSLRSADSGDRDGAQYPEPSAKPRRRIATDPVHGDDGTQTPSGAAIAPSAHTIPPVATPPASPPPPRFHRRAVYPVPRLSRGQDPPPVHV